MLADAVDPGDGSAAEPEGFAIALLEGGARRKAQGWGGFGNDVLPFLVEQRDERGGGLESRGAQGGYGGEDWVVRSA